MSNQIWSTSLTLVGFAATLLQIRKNRHGWSVAFICQIMWAVYALTTFQMGFMLGVVINSTFSVYGFLRWSRKPARQQPYGNPRELCLATW